MDGACEKTIKNTFHCTIKIGNLKKKKKKRLDLDKGTV